MKEDRKGDSMEEKKGERRKGRKEEMAGRKE